MKVAEADSDDEGGADAADELEDDEDDLGDADAEYIESLENGVCVCVLSSYAGLNCSPAFGIMSRTDIQEMRDGYYCACEFTPRIYGILFNSICGHDCAACVYSQDRVDVQSLSRIRCIIMTLIREDLAQSPTILLYIVDGKYKTSVAIHNKTTEIFYQKSSV